MDSAADQDLANLLDQELADCSFKRRELPKLKLQTTTTPFGDLKTGAKGLASEVDAAATMLQKAYKSYRTRRNLADCAVFIEELWWKALDFSALRRSSISFFDSDRSETAASRWVRARTRAAKLGKGLSKDEKAQQLALRHWLEAIDPRHRYGHNLHFYYDVWFDSESSQPFFYWLDVGDGKEVNLKSCPRTQLQRQCIKYLGPKERRAYEVVVEDGKLVFKQTGVPVSTIKGTKWIFVLSASRNIYVGQKEKASFHHSSFLAGGAAIAAGRIVARNGLLEAIWSYSGHYRFGEENFVEFLNFLEEQNVDLRQAKKYPTDDDIPPSKVTVEKPELGCMGSTSNNTLLIKVGDNNIIGHLEASSVAAIDNGHPMASMHMCSCQDDHDKDKKVANAPPGQHSSGKWTTGAGPRIGCVREYPAALQLEALQRLNLSPRAKPGISISHSGPIRSPRPSSKVHLSPRLLFLGLASPKVDGKPIRHASLING